MRISSRLRGWPVLQFAIAAFGLAASDAQAQARPFDVGPPPAWVETHVPATESTAAAGQLGQNVHYLLVDNQVRVDERERLSYRHVASKAVNSQGVESESNIEIRYDPSYQRLTLHHVSLRREGRVIPKLASARVRKLQRETDLEALVFDGSVSASIVLDDVRVGDVVEYAYTLSGANPVFGQRRFGRFDMQWSAPVSRSFARLLWPANRPLYQRSLNQVPPADVRQAGAYTDYRWDRSDVQARQVDNDAPSWFDPYAAVQWSEFKDWRAVVDWAEPLYRLPQQAAAPVQAVATSIAQDQADPLERMRAVLLYVQREVRYLGVEAGTGSHAPSPPQVVLQRRFGDCKDKALLTVALLRALGLEAQPALVHTGMREAIAAWQPTPGAFNHVLVKARVAGRDWWLDPTRAPQAGSAERLVQADMGLALVVAPQTSALETMAGDSALRLQRRVHALIDTSAGLDKAARYTVTTTLQGRAADNLRGTLATTNLDRLQKQYLNFYAGYYPGIEVAAPMEVRDEALANTLSTVEHYSVPKFWQRAEGRRRLEASIEVPDLADVLRAPRTPVRDAPLALSHPLELEHLTEVRLPEDWTITPERLTVEDPAFEFERQDVLEGRTLKLKDRYRSRLPYVEAADVARYATQLEKARQSIRYKLHYTPAADAGVARGAAPHWLPATAAALTLLVALALALRLYRWDPLPWPVGLPVNAGAPRGLGGWLAVAGLGMVLASYHYGSALVTNAPAYSAERWTELTTPGEAAYNALWAPVLLFEMLALILLGLGHLLALLLFLQRRSSLPLYYLLLMAAGTAFMVLDRVAAELLPRAADADAAAAVAEVVRGLLGCAVWSAYFLRSGRVRNTFVQRRSPALPVPVPQAVQPAG